MDLSYQVQNMLKLLKSGKTKVEINNDIKKEKYNFMSDKIYISKNTKTVQKGLEGANPFCLKLIAMYKVCFEARQSKALQAVKLLLNNISIIMFGMTILFRIVLGKSKGVCLLTTIVMLIFILLSLLMEIDAYKKACKQIKKTMTSIGDKDITKDNVNDVEKLIKKNKIKLIINKTKYRLFMIAIVLLLMI